MTDEELRREVKRLKLEVRRLARAEKSIRRELRQKSKLWDTVCSPPWQRLWWFLQGFRLWKVGRWRNKTDDLK